MQLEISATPIRRLNNLGLKRFDEWLSTKGEDNKTSVAPPVKLYFSAETSELVEGIGTVPRHVSSKMEMAVAVNHGLGGKRQALMFDDGLWSALCLLWIDSTIPEFKGKRQIKNKGNYLMPSFDELRDKGLGYRHRVWGPCYMEARFGKMSRVFLTGDISTMSEAMDALIYFNQAYLSVAQAIDALYMTVDGEFIGDGNMLDEYQKSMNLRRGEIEDFIEHCRQIGYTHSLAHVSPEILVTSANALEFAPQLTNYRRRREANDLPWASMPTAVAAAA